MNSIKKIAITTGDLSGIGLEITVKALDSIKQTLASQYFVFYSKESMDTFSLKKIEDFHRSNTAKIYSNFKEALLSDTPINFIVSDNYPADWVIEAAQACNSSKINSLITGPLSKDNLQKAGFPYVGHTDIFKKIFSIENLYMGFLGSKFNVILLTDHSSLKNACNSIDENSIKKFLAVLKNSQHLFFSNLNKPIGFLGLNPHAGENGLLGSEEFFIKKAIEATDMNIVGPLVPDTAFHTKNWGAYAAYLCPYHDQGLIPFKMIHGFNEGVHLTLGLPFIRLSVTHGTASDIFNKNIADFSSMKECILLANNFRTLK